MFVENKVVLITGAASGIGLCLVKELLKEKAKVCIADVNQNLGNEAVRSLETEYGARRVIFCKVDVTNKEEFEEAMKKTVQVFDHLDIVINNAGLLNDSTWEQEIDVNLKGVINGCLLAMETYLPKYRSTPKAIIVNIASNLGLYKPGELPVYSTTKCAVIGLGKCLASEENYKSQKVDIITVCPGATDTALLHGFANKGVNERYNRMLETFFTQHDFQQQKPEELATIVVNLLENCRNGSVWEIDSGRCREVIVQDEPEFKKV